MPVSSASRNVWTVSRMSGKICKGEDIKVKGNHSLPIIPLCTCSSVPSQESEASSSPQDTSPGVPRPRETVLTVGMWSIIPSFWKEAPGFNTCPFPIFVVRACCISTSSPSLFKPWYSLFCKRRINQNQPNWAKWGCSHVHCDSVSNVIRSIAVPRFPQHSVHDGSVPGTNSASGWHCLLYQ